MAYAKYRLSDNQFLCVYPQRMDFDPATEGVEEYLEHERPSTRLHRYDPAAPDKKRLATAQELADYDEARRASAADVIADRDPVLIAMAELIRTEINLVRQSVVPALPDRTRPQIVDRLKIIYRGVLNQLGL